MPQVLALHRPPLHARPLLRYARGPRQQPRLPEGPLPQRALRSEAVGSLGMLARGSAGQFRSHTLCVITSTPHLAACPSLTVTRTQG
jgi:hypothetical protein